MNGNHLLCSYFAGNKSNLHLNAIKMNIPQFKNNCRRNMDSQIATFPTLVISIFFIFLLAAFLIKNSKHPRHITSKLPPGPRKLPMIGNLHNLIGPLPHCMLRDLSEKYGPLMHLQLGEVSAVVASSPEMAREIMKTHDVTFASRPAILATEILSYGSKSLAFAPYGEFWRQIRKICTLELLCAKRIRSFAYVREEESLKFVQWIASNSGSPINLSKKIYYKSYEVISRMAFGRKTKEHEEFIAIAEEALSLASGFDVGDLFPSYKLLHKISGMRPKLERLHQKSDRIMDGIIKDHKKKLDTRSGLHAKEDHADDLVDVLLKYERGREGFTLTMENVKAVLLDIFAAGSDTAATTVEWALSEMIKNPRLLEKAQAEVRKVFQDEKRVVDAKLVELEFLKMVIKETLRMHPPVPLLLPRECREKCEINEYEIPAKTKVIVNGWAINRDPRYWKDPETFNPERFHDDSVDFRGNSFEYIPFGAGRRICPGMNLGLANVELALANLLYHFDWDLPRGMKNQDLDMTESSGLTVGKKNGLYLIPIVYQSPPRGLIPPP